VPCPIRMNGSHFFEAPWGTALRWCTGLCSGLFVFMIVLGLTLSKQPTSARLMMVVFPCVFTAVGALFTIRGYELNGGSLLIHRPGWKTRVPLDGLRSVTVDPEAIRKSIRSFGNGGFFSFTGWYANKTLGSYRLFGTDLKRTVVLRFEHRRVVVTPEDPEVFARCLREQAGLHEGGS
jgi:hypothetical protein